MRRGSRPRSHAVPKLEDLLLAVRPQILVIQIGSNLFDLFRDRKTVQPDRQGPALKTFIQPFISEALKPSSPVQRLYWVSPPTSGRVSREIQDFVLEQVRSAATGHACVIDSRPFVSYPYRHMAPDHEHFFEEQMDQWAGKVFGTIEGDLSSRPLPSQGPPEQSSPPAPTPSSTPITPVQPGEKAVRLCLPVPRAPPLSRRRCSVFLWPPSCH